MKVIDSMWFINNKGTAGIVLIEEDITGARMAYIGVASGEDEKADNEVIMAYGSPLSLDAVKRIERFLKK